MYRVVKQLHPAPSASSDPHWAKKKRVRCKVKW